MSPTTRRRIARPTQNSGGKPISLVNSVLTLRTARRIARLTQRQLAARVGVDHSFISLLEDGKRDVDAAGYGTVVRIARALGIEPAEELFPVAVLPVEAVEKSA